MKTKLLYAKIAIVFMLFLAPPSLGIKAEDIIRLKKAGVTEQTIQFIIREKTLETCAFSTEEILALKKAGLKEETMRLLIKESSFLRNREPIVYGRDIRPLKLTSAQDIIRLKKAGVSDEIIKAILTALHNQNAADRDKAWKMLESLEIRIDQRDP